MPVPGLTLHRGGDWRATEAQTETYPVTRTLDASKNGPPFQCYYTVTKASKDEPGNCKEPGRRMFAGTW